jgi:ferritin
MNKSILENLSEQLNKEVYSGYFYLSMAGYANSIGFKGTANWFIMQMREELMHAQRFYDYIEEKGQRVILKAIDEPPKDFSSVKDLFEKTLAHEKKVTGLIDALLDLAKKENDKETEKFLQWFVKEQVEEEATPAKILKKFEGTGEDKDALLKIDKELEARVFNFPQGPPKK